MPAKVEGPVLPSPVQSSLPVQPSSTRGTSRGQAFSRARRPQGTAGGGVGVALHGGVGGDDEDVAGAGGGAGGGGAGLDDAQHGDGHGVLNGVEGQGAGGVAGDDEEFCALLVDQEAGAFSGVAGDGAAGLGAVGEAGGVAEEGEAGAGQCAR